MKLRALLLMVSVICLFMLAPAAALSQGPSVTAGCGAATVDGVMSPGEWAGVLLGSILSCAQAAIGEEVVFRGYLLTGLDKAWGKWIGLIATAILFSLPHLTVMGAQETNWLLFTVLLALPGLLLGWTFLQSRSLWLPVGIHFAWNLMQDDVFNLLGRDVPSLIGAVTRQQGPEHFVGTSYGIEVGLAGIAGVVLVWLGVWFWTRKDRQPQEAK